MPYLTIIVNYYCSYTIPGRVDGVVILSQSGPVFDSLDLVDISQTMKNIIGINEFNITAINNAQN